MHSVRFLFLPMVLSLLLSGCAQTRETSSTIFAMNTVMELTAYGDSGQQVLDQATERIYQLEHLLSVTDENSDISAINHGEGAWVPVSQETFQLLSLALSYGREPQGALDITAYSAVHAWGFTTGEYRVPGPEELAELAKSNLPLLLREKGSGTRFYTDRFFREHGFRPERSGRILELNSPDAIKSMLRTGFGVTVISELAVRDE